MPYMAAPASTARQRRDAKMASGLLADGERLLASPSRRAEALHVFRGAVRASPSSGDASHFLAFALGLSERHAEAEAQFVHTTTLLPRSPIVWFNLGNAQREHSSI